MSGFFIIKAPLHKLYDLRTSSVHIRTLIF